ncbi:TIR domain-containing protein [Terrisporobacter hibernicus]|uniref:TIR domain-containing protein n=1 Tax=Terrisporobacter hibernicus TaxID=2813371 RepID=A0AAX2ZJZ3_9FIRM|nr:TIR domain-containing protein [Terrisporobacter hibernicus]UEL49166.1 TIR domain-containing protein [Terrisporobacter hibernicus]
MGKVYNVFVSHSWSHVADLVKLRELLKKRGYFNIEFKEVPPMDPINSENASYIKSILRKKINESDVIIGMAGIYASYSDWMDWEMSVADDYGIKIIGVVPRGNTNISQTVRNHAIDIVRWNTESIVDAIRRYSK